MARFPMINCAKNKHHIRFRRASQKGESAVRSLGSLSLAAHSALPHPEFVRNVRLLEWVSEIAGLTQPANIHWCDGSQAEYDDLCSGLVAGGTFRRLNPVKRPGSYLALSDPSDVARVEDRTFICSTRKEDAGPTNNWLDPGEMKRKLLPLFDGSMRGRTMYVVPFSMGPFGSPLAQTGVQITDSAYVAVSMRIMTRMGRHVLDALGVDGNFVPCLHSVGMPLARGQADVPWPCNKDHKYIVHFPEENSIWSFGSGYGGNALLGKKCLALRIASSMGRRQGWLAEHMLILGVESPQGRKELRCRGFSQRLRQDQFRDDDSTARVQRLESHDDRRRHRLDQARRGGPVARDQSGVRLLRCCPRHFGEIQSERDGDVARQYCIFTNVALTEDGDVWWEGMTDQPPATTHRLAGPGLDTGLRPAGRASECALYRSGSAMPFHRSGLGKSARACRFRPSYSAAGAAPPYRWSSRASTGPTASTWPPRWVPKPRPPQPSKVGEVRRDPMAMLPFCGYHIGDYFDHWLTIGRGIKDPPRIFGVNWFRKDADGKFLWPGYGENMRVLKWIVDRCRDSAGAMESPLGWMPRHDDLEWNGLGSHAGPVCGIDGAGPGQLVARACPASGTLREARQSPAAGIFAEAQVPARQSAAHPGTLGRRADRAAASGHQFGGEYSGGKIAIAAITNDRDDGGVFDFRGYPQGRPQRSA